MACNANRNPWPTFTEVAESSRPAVLSPTILARLFSRANATIISAALAVWRYCKDSAQYIFGDATGNPVADRILAALQGNPNGLSRTEIRGIFSRNRSEGEISQALATLVENRSVRCKREVTADVR